MTAMFVALAALTWHDASPGRIELRERGEPVLVYNYGMQLGNGAPPGCRRSGYVHPVWAPNGAVITDDFPKDQWHFRGIFWAWPSVRHKGQQYDLWKLDGQLQSRFVKWLERKPGILAVENGWFSSDESIARETVRIQVHPVSGRARRIDFEIMVEATDAPIEIAGSGDGGSQKSVNGCGGFSIRFAPRANSKIRTEKGVMSKDFGIVRDSWTEMEGLYEGKRARVRIESHPENPGHPEGWVLRQPEDVIATTCPRRKPVLLERGKPLTLRYTVMVTSIE